METEDKSCYSCNKPSELYMIQCEKCNTYFHSDCLKSGNPSPLYGDTFFNFICLKCSQNGLESLTRIKLQWFQVVILVLFNLSHSSEGNCGYFRWKEHICDFINKHWSVLFGQSRKKTATWCGTVAGALSAGCPRFFKSGFSVLNEHGWWALCENRPPTLDSSSNVKSHLKRSRDKKEECMGLVGPRLKHSKSTVQAAIERRAKKDSIQEPNSICKSKSCSSLMTAGFSNQICKSQLNSSLSDVNSEKPSSSVFESTLSTNVEDSSRTSTPSKFVVVDDDSRVSFSSSKSEFWLTEQDLKAEETIPERLLDTEEVDVECDFEIDPCSTAIPFCVSPTDSLFSISNSNDFNIRSQDDFQVEDLPASENGPFYKVGGQTSEKKPITYFDGASTSENDKSFDRNACFQPIFKKEVEETESINKSADNKNDITKIKLFNDSEIKKYGDKNEFDQIRNEIETSDCDSLSGQTMTRISTASNTDDENTASPDVFSKDKSLSKKVDCIAKPPRCFKMSLNEEKQLLNQLNSRSNIFKSNPQLNVLKRKLFLRQLKREKGLPIFNLDETVLNLCGFSFNLSQEENYRSNSDRFNREDCSKDFRILDRFQTPAVNCVSQAHQSVSFLNRLVGTEDDQLQSTPSPYTTRLLKPFIRRDYETKPLKMKLLQEICLHKNEDVPSSVKAYPIDYCYVRPQHIVSINTLARQFFWPGIDLSECLQYPDFTCVVLYRKFVIGFALMVPDVKPNEAYISFIFTHPEWRRAGIAKFMLYHLIQTCMGKDVTLHVSASNPALFLYQKFGFKPEEFIVDFYDKYYPIDSKECRHAFFLRLSR